MNPAPVAAEGGCTCRAVRYRLTDVPLIVHCCHCRWCQRETGSAFALNALIESNRVELLSGRPQLHTLPTLSGKGQQLARCPQCLIALWSHYAGLGERLSFIRVGTLDAPDGLPPAVHIFTASKQPWVQLPEGVPAFAQYYRTREVWSPASLARRQALVS
jgi:hypothetical protein